MVIVFDQYRSDILTIQHNPATFPSKFTIFLFSFFVHFFEASFLFYLDMYALIAREFSP